MAGQPTFDATEQVKATPFGDLPVWDLTDLYPAPDAPELADDIARLETMATDFAARYQGTIQFEASELGGLSARLQLQIRQG